MERRCAKDPARDEAEYRKRAVGITDDFVNDYRRSQSKHREVNLNVEVGDEGDETIVELVPAKTPTPLEEVRKLERNEWLQEALSGVLSLNNKCYTGKDGARLWKYDNALAEEWFTNPERSARDMGRGLSSLYAALYGNRRSQAAEEHACRRLKSIIERFPDPPNGLFD